MSQIKYKLITAESLKYVHDKLETEIENIDQSAIAEAVADWCDENITEDPTVVIDSSLSVEGAAADSKATGDEISTLKSAFNASLQTKVSKPSTNPDGTSGQLLRTNGDGTTVWVDEGLPTDEQTAQAVSDWLDDHPEATTTVQDGSITLPKLNDSLKSVVTIQKTTDKAYYHSDVNNVEAIDFYGNTLAFSTAQYINAKNILPSVTKSLTANGVSLQANGHFVTYNNTATSGGTVSIIDTKLTEKIPAGSYKLYIQLTEKTSSIAAQRFILKVKYDVENPAWVEMVNKWVGGSLNNVYDFTTEYDVTEIWYQIGVVNGFTYNNFRVWSGIYDASATVVDTEITVSTDEVETYSDNSLYNLETIDTIQHESIVKCIENTKQYIDDHTPDIIGYWTDNVYALPEDFGAVGDGVTDDAQALADCIAYSITSGKPVRGFGKYKTSETVTIDGRYLDVYLHEINYTGNGCAVDIQEPDVVFKFHRIVSSADGINFGSSTSSDRKASRCQVYGNGISSTGDCITQESATYYNTCEIRNLSSTNANCIVGGGGEYVFRSSSCNCPNGWVMYGVVASKAYDFTIEGNCKYGMLNPIDCMFFGFRHREQVDAMGRRLEGDSSINNGALIKFTQSPSTDGKYGFKYVSNDQIPWVSIDTSDIQNYDTIPNGEGSVALWQKLAYNGIDLGTPICGATFASRFLFAKTVYFIGSHQVYVPADRLEYTLDKATYDMSLYESAVEADIVSAHHQGGWGTDYITGYSHTDFYCNASYGAIGYNDLTITQKDDYTCTFYDKLGNVIFDGTDLGNGKWRLQCIIDRSSFGRYEGTTTWWCYDGTNEKWIITKLS